MAIRPARPLVEQEGMSTRQVFDGAAKGIVWTYVSLIGSKLLVFVATAILARLLAPSQFGQIACALVVISYLDTIGNLGVGSALIYEPKRTEQAADVAFTISLLMGAVWFGLAFVLAPLAAAFFKEPAVTPILRTMAWTFPITALGSTHDGLLRRSLAFKQRALPDIVGALTKGTGSVMLAWLGYGVWSLIWGQLIGAATSTLVLWRIVHWRPRWRFPLDLARRMLRYGSQIVSVNVLSAVLHHIDLPIVGRLLGSAALGFYSLAYRIPELAIIMMIWAVGNVTFPAYSRLQGDRPALQRAFLTTLRYLSLLTIPAGLGLAALAAPLVRVVYGNAWEPAIPVLQALAIGASLRSLATHAGDVYKATGRPDILTKLGLVRAALQIPALIFGARFGIVGVAVAQLLATAASTLLNLVVAARMLSVPLRSIVAEFRLSLLGSGIMVVSLWLLRPLVSEWSHLTSLAAAVSVGAAVYVLVTWTVSPEMMRRAWASLAPRT